MKMKYRFLFFFLVLLLTGCANHQVTNSAPSDQDIEVLLVGNWFVSQVDTTFYMGNSISSYTKGHNVFFIAYADSECRKPLFETEALWEVKDRILIITVIKSSAPHIHPTGLVVTDEILSIDDANKVLKSIKNEHRQLRTKSSSCAIESI
jgi:hypothetical protein